MNAIRFGSINLVNFVPDLTQSRSEEYRWKVDQLATDCPPPTKRDGGSGVQAAVKGVVGFRAALVLEALRTGSNSRGRSISLFAPKIIFLSI